MDFRVWRVELLILNGKGLFPKHRILILEGKLSEFTVQNLYNLEDITQDKKQTNLDLSDRQSLHWCSPRFGAKLLACDQEHLPLDNSLTPLMCM